ncbi:MAG: methyltransferase domain-containing protein [Deltaproteobacteria bacterium]|nr:methyltransferase domain-containing protein [Deltaproteobacteria bacterium]
MKRVLLNLLICPACLPAEIVLGSRIIKEEGEDILEGSLSCPQCGNVYPVREGIAFLDPVSPARAAKHDSKYETAPVLSSYLWSHYGDILKDPEATPAYREWADLMAPHAGMAVDAGSAVGRFTFEMSLKSDFAVGVDNSLSFIRSARRLMMDRSMKIDLKEEGHFTREVVLSLPEAWDSRKVEFIVGDAQCLPFPSGTFSSLASLNLVDKVPVPLRHMKELHRLAAEQDAQLLLSDPFSWSEDAAPQENWLGGTEKGPFTGRGMENIMALLANEKNGWSPLWRVERHGHIWWKIRTHANHFELIRSCFVKAVR